VILRHRPLALVSLMLALAVAHSGCARFSRLPPPPSEEVRARLGTIGIVSGRFVPEADFRRPAKGEAALRNAGRWAGQWAGAALTPIGGPDPLSLLIRAALLVVGTPFAAGAGAIAGAVNAPSGAEVSEFETALKSAFADLGIQPLIRDGVLGAARQTRDRVVLAADHGPSRPEDEGDNYRALAHRRIDTVLEVSVLALDMVGETAYDPPALLIRLRTRLVRVADGTTLYTHRIRYLGPSRIMEEWITDGARSFRDEVTRACRILADTIVDEVFLHVVVK